MLSVPVARVLDVFKEYKVGEAIYTALKGVTLEIWRGDLIAVMGPSGSGKTTLLNIIGLLDRPTRGRVYIDGIDTSRLSDIELARIRNVKIGFVFQTFNLINRLTVYENVELPLLIRGLDRQTRERLVHDALVKAGGELSWLKKRPLQLSGGQQQRVAIARAIVTSPSLILADEPTGNLDRNSSQMVMKTFLDLNRMGQTVVIVTHNLEIAACAKKIVYLRDGKITDTTESVDSSKCILFA